MNHRDDVGRTLDKCSLIFQAETLLPTEFGHFRFRIYKDDADNESMAIVSQNLDLLSDVPVRVHSACFTSEVIGSLKCDCKQQLHYALSFIAENGGVVIYLPQEGRGIGLSNKIRAYALQEDGHDTIDANHLLNLPIDSRSYEDAAFILRDLKVQNIRLLTNNPLKIASMINLGFTITEHLGIPVVTNPHSHTYIETKRSKMGHTLRNVGFENFSLKTQTCTITRPFIHINLALNENGEMNKKNGEAINLSCEKDWRRVHELRERYSAVSVGANTWNLDRPRLTVRKESLGRAPLRQPHLVIFAGNTDCIFEEDSNKKSTRDIFLVGKKNIKHKSTTFIPATEYDLETPLKNLYQQGVETLLVEGGKTLVNSFLKQGKVDRLTVYVSTRSADKAKKALKKLFPYIPIPDARIVPFGKGTLISYITTPNINHHYSEGFSHLNMSVV